MKAFHFRLEHLLGLRQQEEELHKLKLGQANRVCEEIKQSLDEVRQEQVRSSPTVSLNDFVLRQAWLHRLAKERKDLEHQSVKAEEAKAVVLVEYVESRKKAEVLRKLEERQHAEYKQDYIREQESLQDDLVQARGIIKSQNQKLVDSRVKEEHSWHS